MSYIICSVTSSVSEVLARKLNVVTKAYQNKINSFVLVVIFRRLALKTLKYFWPWKILDRKYINIYYTPMNHKM